MADKVRRKALCFWLSEEQKLYKRSFSGPYLLCVHSKVVEPLLKEYIREFLEAIQGANHYPIGPSLRDIGG